MVRVSASDSIGLAHPDGSTSTLLLTPATAQRRGITVLVIPGIAVGARYYRPLAEGLAAAGFDVGSMELRGQGDSTHTPGRRGDTAGFHETAGEDIPLALDHLENTFGDQLVILLGHSMGAQKALYNLARGDRRVAGMVGVATQSPYYRGYDGRIGRWMRVGSVIMPAVGLALGYVPAQFFGAADGKIPASRVRDWAKLAGRNSMQPARADLDYPSGLAQVTSPILLIAIAGDEQAPVSAGENLLALVPEAKGTIEFEPTELGHNRWARQPELIVERIARWADAEVRSTTP